MGPRDRQKTGMISCLVLFQKSSKGEVYPITGSHLKCKANTYIIKIPNQKVGIVIPILDTVVTRLSTQEPRRIAQITPAGIPIIVATIKARTPMYKVMGKRLNISSITGDLLSIDVPRLPRNSPETQSIYCAGNDLSRPYWCLIWASCSWVTCCTELEETNINTGSPGKRRIAMKTNTETRNSTITDSTSLRIMKFAILSLCFRQDISRFEWHISE